MNMNQGVVRWLDKNIGSVFCFLLTVCRRFGKEDNKDASKPSKALFIKLVEQGSTVLAYQALKKAASMVGRDNLYFLVFKENRYILDMLDILPPGNVIEIDSSSPGSMILSVTKALIRIRKEKIDAVIDMEFFSRGSAVLSYLSGADKRVGFHLFTCEGPYRGDLFTHRLIYNPYLHIRDLFASLVEALSHNPLPDNKPMCFKISRAAKDLPSFFPSESDKSSLVKKIEKLKKSNLTSPIILLNPDMDDLLQVRRWPEENYVKLARMILQGFSRATIIITGTPGEKEKGNMLAYRMGDAISLSGETSLRELLTLYCMADLLVTSDSGPAHFSTLTPIKTIILFGPETSRLYGEEDVGKVSMDSDLICSPCVNVYNHRKSPCKEGVCLKNIKPEDVFQRVKVFLTA